MIRILFVCLGNICRSPTAEAVFCRRAEQVGMLPYLQVDSCGTGDWHIGKSPDPRAQRAARERGYDLSALTARQISASDFHQFDYILAMDGANMRDILVLKADSCAKHTHTPIHIARFLDYHPDARCVDVPDPYYGGEEGFDEVLDLIEVASDELLLLLARERESARDLTAGKPEAS